MVDYTKPQQRKKEESEKLRRARDAAALEISVPCISRLFIASVSSTSRKWIHGEKLGVKRGEERHQLH